MTSYQSYAKKIIRCHLQSFLKQKTGVRQARDIEYIHRMRVAARRLRTAFEIFADAFPKKDIKKWNKEIKRTAKALGKARDLDVQIVFLKELRSRMKNLKYRASIDKFIKIRALARKNYQAEVTNAINQLESRRICEIIAETLIKPCGNLEKNFTGKLTQKARQSIAQQLDNVLGHEIYVEQPNNVEELHRMRIAMKRLRYTMETFEPIYRTKISRFIKAAIAIQRLLGELHDLDMWIDSLPVKAINATSALDINYLRRRCQGLRLQTYKRFVKCWLRLRMERCWEGLRKTITSYEYANH